MLHHHAGGEIERMSLALMLVNGLKLWAQLLSGATLNRYTTSLQNGRVENQRPRALYQPERSRDR